MPDASRFAGIKQVAARARVSVSTASRVLGGHGYSSPEARARVEQAARELGYEPHLVARSLKRRSSRMIGLVIQDIVNPFYAFVAKGCEDVVRAAGYNLMLCDSEEDARREKESLRMLLQTRVDGVVITPTTGNGQTLALLQMRGIAIVQVDRVVPGVRSDALLINNFGGAYQATTHLLDVGHRIIGVIAGPPSLTTGRERRRGVEAAMAERGVAMDERYVKVGDFRRESGYQLARMLLDLDPRPTALFPHNNVTAEGALQAIYERGLSIPTDIAVVAFDDAPWARYLSPPLTVVSQPAYRIGAMAAELLLRRLAGPDPDDTDGPVTTVLDPTLIVRGSCGSTSRPEGTVDAAPIIPPFPHDGSAKEN